MDKPLTPRGVARLVIAALVAAALVPLTGAPASATPGCLEETVPSLLQDGCDDSTPPDTEVTPSVTPNALGLVTVPAVTFTLSATVTDADPGPFGFECSLSGPAQAHDWQSCPATVALSGLADGSYVFQARAVDLGDVARDPDNPLWPGVVVDTPDLDPSPAVIRWRQDTRAPFVFVTSTTYDADTPTQPVVTTESVPIRLHSSEPGSTFECRDNRRRVACSGGRWQLRGARAGRHVFAARSIDPAGNASAWSDPVEFYVPENLRRARGWTRVRGEGHFRGDALRTRTRGARIVLPRRRVGELRLLAPSRPGLGRLRIRVGRGAWHVVDLAGSRSDLRQVIVLDRFSGVRRGRVVIEALGSRPVVIDAVVARPHTFPTGH